MASGEMDPAKSQRTNSNGLVALRSGALLNVWTILPCIHIFFFIKRDLISVLSNS